MFKDVSEIQRYPEDDESREMIEETRKKMIQISGDGKRGKNS